MLRFRTVLILLFVLVSLAALMVSLEEPGHRGLAAIAAVVLGVLAVVVDLEDR